jgi:hypothetical protein
MFNKLEAAGRGRREKERRERLAAAEVAGNAEEKKETRDQFYERLDGKMKSCFLIWSCLQVRALVCSRRFNAFMNLVIIIAGILVGISTYPGMEDDPNLILFDKVILVTFTIEVLLKIIADPFRPWDFFVGA